MKPIQTPTHVKMAGNALNDFVNAVTIYQGKPGKIDRSLIYIAAGASAWLVLLGVFGLWVDPVTFGPAWEEHRWFYVRDQINSLIALYHYLWFIPLGSGAALGATTAVLSQVKSGKWSRRLCGSLPVTAAILTLPLALAVCGILIYALIVATVFAAFIALLLAVILAALAGAA